VREDAITVSLDLPGFRVVETIEAEDAVEAVIETTVPAGCCPRCGHGTLRSKGRRDRVLRDVPVRAKPLYLRWRRRSFRCERCGHRFLERHEALPPRVRATARFEAYLYRRTRPGLVPLAHVARCEQVSFYRVQTAHSKGAAGELATGTVTLRALSVDEASFKRRQDYNTVISAPELHRTIELVRGRDGTAFAVWAGMLPDDVRHAVEAFCADLWEPYHLVAAAAFPNAVRVADHFHVIRHANRALDDVRRSAQRRPVTGWRPELFRARFVLLRRSEDLTAADRARLHSVFAAHPELDGAWRLKEALRTIYATADAESAGPELVAWCREAESSGLPPFQKMAATVREWKGEILGYFHDRVTNAFAEGVTNKVKCIKRIGFGYRNFETFRERVLAACL
jgi:transposase